MHKEVKIIVDSFILGLNRGFEFKCNRRQVTDAFKECFSEYSESFKSTALQYIAERHFEV